MVLLDAKYLQIYDNAATSKKTWWNNCKKQFIVTKSDYHIKSRRPRLLSTSSYSSKNSKSS